MANRLKTELRHWRLDNMDQCKVGLEVVSTDVDDPYQQTKRFLFGKVKFKIGFKVKAAVKGAIKGAKALS